MNIIYNNHEIDHIATQLKYFLERSETKINGFLLGILYEKVKKYFYKIQKEKKNLFHKRKTLEFSPTAPFQSQETATILTGKNKNKTPRGYKHGLQHWPK